MTSPSNPRVPGARRRLPKPARTIGFRPSRSWWSAAVPLLLVAVVLGSSLGEHPHRAAPAVTSQGGAAVVLSRTLSCVADAPGAATRIGAVPASTTGYSTQPGQPGRVTFEPAVAANGYGSQWATGKGWLAARACPEPADDWWFTGAGAGISHRSYLTLDNPRSNDANVTITVFGPQGEVQAPGLSGLLVPAGQSLKLDLESIAPSLGDLTVHVKVVRGLVAASMWETWALSAVAPSVSAWVPPAPDPAQQVQVIGIPAKADAATLLVTNPGTASIVATVRATNGTASFSPADKPTVTVPPGTTVPVDLTGLLKLGIGAVSVSVPSSGALVTAGLRIVRANAEAYAAAALNLGTVSTAGLPAMGTMSLSLSSAEPATVQVTAVDATGAQVLTKTVPLGAATVTLLPLPPTTAALRVTEPASAAVVGSVVVDNGGIAVIGLAPTANAAVVPVVVQRPY